tara:strand:- start:67 stop:1083 length:1017 start_codon:yes stop_codon:yes gene_type:complete
VRHLEDFDTPSLVVDLKTFYENLEIMSANRPGLSLRPHVKAFKSTAVASILHESGHTSFCCATIREIEGMAKAGFDGDLLLANEVLDATRLGSLVSDGAKITVAVDSSATITAAAQGGVKDVLIDVNVGLPRCGCDLAEVENLVSLSQRHGLNIRGVMGYEGHLMFTQDREERSREVTAAMGILREAHSLTGGEVISAGGTGTYDLNSLATEIQAGSFLFMDTRYSGTGLPFQESLTVMTRIISVEHHRKWAVADAGVKAIGMDYGKPEINGGAVMFCSDEHTTLFPEDGKDSVPWEVGDLVSLRPAHIDPTISKHPRILCVDDGYVVEEWLVDLRDW